MVNPGLNLADADVCSLAEVSHAQFIWSFLSFSGKENTPENTLWTPIEKPLQQLVTHAVPLLFKALLDNSLSDNSLLQQLGQTKHVQVDVYLVTNDEIQAINHQHRQKNKATDVLSFTLLSDSEDQAMWLALPEVELGNIFLSVDWARANGMEAFSGETTDNLNSTVIFLLDRFLHGMLHLLGQHHDTQADYETVVAIQKQVRQHAIRQYR